MAAHRARRLAQHTRLIDEQPRPRASASLLEMIEHHLARRAAHLAAVEAIDSELGRVYERLSADRPASVPDAPSASPAPVAAVQPAPRAPLPPLTTGTTIAAAADAIVAAIAKEQGQVTGDWINAACAGFSEQTIKRARTRLIESGRLLRTGKTAGTRYQLQPMKPVTTPSANGLSSRDAKPSRTVIADGIEYEPAWTPHRDAPSLIGDRPTRNA
jgi:hypothetical protein